MDNKYNNLIHEYEEQELIDLIRNKKLEIDVNELLKHSIIWYRNKLVKYLLDNEKIDFKYSDEGWDFLINAVAMQNLCAVKLLEEKGFNLKNNYKLGERKNILYFIKDINTLKYFENVYDKNEIEKALSYIIADTVITKDLKLLKYIISEYKIDNLSEIKCGDEYLTKHINDVKALEQKLNNKHKDDVEYIEYYNNKVKPYYEYLEKYLEVKK